MLAMGIYLTLQKRVRQDHRSIIQAQLLTLGLSSSCSSEAEAHQPLKSMPPPGKVLLNKQPLAQAGACLRLHAFLYQCGYPPVGEHQICAPTRRGNLLTGVHNGKSCAQ
jgi:hypothetical protein